MKVQVLVATMHQKDHSLIERMNIQTDAVVVNQCDKEDFEELEHNGKQIKFISKNERGLSRSRNLALDAATGDVCIIADDDLVYQDRYEEMVKQAYEEIPKADIMVFDVPLKRQLGKKKFGNDKFQMSYRRALQVNSVRITFKLSSIKNSDVRFNPVFGAGAIYTHGEENIFIKECVKKGLKIYYYPHQLGVLSPNESTWFKGYDREYFFDIGAIYYELFGFLYLPLAMRLALRKRKELKDIGLLSAIKASIKGKKEYRKHRVWANGLCDGGENVN